MAELCASPYPPSQEELLSACVAECIVANLNAFEDNDPLTCVVRDCDYGGGSVCCNRVTASSRIVPAAGARGAAVNVKSYDATVTVSVLRPQALCPDESCGAGGECHVSDLDSYLMGEREHIMRNIEAWLIESGCGSCCNGFDLTSVAKICGGTCGGSRFEIRALNFVMGSLNP